MSINNGANAENVAGDVKRGAAEGAEVYRSNLDAIMASNHALIRGYQAVSAETLAFVQSRMKEALETSQRLAGCRRLEDALEAQIDFMRSSVQAYADEFKRMADVSGRVFGESIEPLSARATEVEKRVARAA